VAARGFALARSERFFAADGEPWPGFAEEFGHELSLQRRAAGRGLLVELHWRLSDDPLGAALAHDRIAPRAVPFGDGLLAPDGPDTLLVLAVHLLHHERDDVRLIWLLDVGLARDALDDDGWSEAFARAGDAGLGWVLHTALDRAEAAFGGARPRPEPPGRPPRLGPLRVGQRLPGALGIHAGRLAGLGWRGRARYLQRAGQALASSARRSSRSA
jgi:hypothetical protein